MFSSENQEQTILEFAEGGYTATSVESFIVDRQASGLSRHTLKFYRQFLKPFMAYCSANSLNLIQDITPDDLRRYFLSFSESRNPGGVHAAHRTLRAFFHWLMEEEVMPVAWQNPILKIKPPKVFFEPLQPISIEDVAALISTCKHGEFTGERDRAIFLFLLGRKRSTM